MARPGRTVILCPGSSDRDGEAHRVLSARGCRWGVVGEPEDGPKREYG